MVGKNGIYEGLLLGQLVGSVVVVASLFLGGINAITVVGGVLILACVAGFAYMATVPETEVDASASAERTDEPSGARRESNR